jgi:dihydropteroate synthase
MRSRLGRVWVGDGEPVRIMGVVNLSPESFYKPSVKSLGELIEAVGQMLTEGADAVDLGAVSTAPYGSMRISEEEELRRITAPIRMIKDHYPEVILSVDTSRARVADEALKLGADVVNDVTGLKGDPDMARVVKDHGASLILVGREVKPRPGLDPVIRVMHALQESLEIVNRFDIDLDKVILDPGIGFPSLSLDPLFTGKPLLGDHRHGDAIPWYVWDSMLILGLGRLRKLGPILVGISRKSFLARLMRRKAQPEDRLFASLSAEAIAVFMGADAVRTHNVKETRDAVRVAEALRKCTLGINECMGVSP